MCDIILTSVISSFNQTISSLLSELFSLESDGNRGMLLAAVSQKMGKKDLSS